MTNTAPLDGLKSIAAFIEQLAATRGIPIRPVREVDVWRWARRQNDRLPTYRRRRGAPETMADPVALESWFARRRFAFATDEPISK